MSSSHCGCICAAGSCRFCGCTFRRPSDVLGHQCAAMQQAQDEIFARNLAWLKKHHPNDPRIPRIEASLGGGS